MKEGYAYIMANKRNGTLYTGSTSDLSQRVWQHKQGTFEGFTKRYGCKILVWFQHFENLADAQQREARMKGWNRKWKLEAIEDMNPDWSDLYDGLG